MVRAVSLKGGGHMTTTTSSASDLMVSDYDIDCPLLCGGASTLTIRGWGKPVTVRPCAGCQAKGGTSWTCTFTQADAYMRPVVTTTWQHQDGLVTFG